MWRREDHTDQSSIPHPRGTWARTLVRWSSAPRRIGFHQATTSHLVTWASGLSSTKSWRRWTSSYTESSPDSIATGALLPQSWDCSAVVTVRWGASAHFPSRPTFSAPVTRWLDPLSIHGGRWRTGSWNVCKFGQLWFRFVFIFIFRCHMWQTLTNISDDKDFKLCLLQNPHRELN